MCKEYHAVLVRISPGYPPVAGWFHTRYSPVRRSPSFEASFKNAAPRLACVRPVASVHPEPGSNSSLYYFFLYNSIENFAFSPSKGAARDSPVLTLTFFTRLVLLCLSFSQRSFALFLTASLAVRIGYSRKASAKIEPFFFPTKYFCYFFSSFFYPNPQQPNNHFIISQDFFTLYSFFLAGIANILPKSPPRKFIPMFLNIAL